MDDNSTPVASEQTDNSTEEATEIVAPSDIQEEPNAPQEASAETSDTKPSDGPELYAGKFKSVDELIKGYKEAEKSISRAAEAQKQLQAYKEQEEQAKVTREMQARSQGFGTVEEQQISNDIAVHEFQLFANALEAGYAGDTYEDALTALQKYQSTGNPNDLAVAKRFFDPQALEIIAENRKAFKDQKMGEYNQKQSQQTFLSAKEKLESFSKEAGDWLDSEVRQEAVATVFNAFGGNTDFGQIKTLIDKIEANAIEQYQTKQKAEQEQQARLDQMQMPGNSVPSTQGKWLTRDQYERMSDTEMTQNHARIVEQMMLEKSGQLPKQITK